MERPMSMFPPEYEPQEITIHRMIYDGGLQDGLAGTPFMDYPRPQDQHSYIMGYWFGGCVRYARERGMWGAYVLFAAKYPMGRTALSMDGKREQR